MRIQWCSYKWTGKVSVPLIEILFQELYRSWLRWQKHSAGRQFSAGFFLKNGLHEKAMCQQWLLGCFLNLSPVSHEEPFLTGTFILGVNNSFIEDLFCVMTHFSLAAFKILFLSLPLESLIIKCLSVGLRIHVIWSSLSFLGVYFVSHQSWETFGHYSFK